ncbi:hypothetical protein HDV02_005525 [Globomyces sp. JEL0801]|nr:hypothetical protein HDV02_005525 [Globomyces sp. JEL0801]
MACNGYVVPSEYTLSKLKAIAKAELYLNEIEELEERYESLHIQSSQSKQTSFLPSHSQKPLANVYTGNIKVDQDIQNIKDDITKLKDNEDYQKLLSDSKRVHELTENGENVSDSILKQDRLKLKDNVDYQKLLKDRHQLHKDATFAGIRLKKKEKGTGNPTIDNDIQKIKLDYRRLANNPDFIKLKVDKAVLKHQLHTGDMVAKTIIDKDEAKLASNNDYQQLLADKAKLKSDANRLGVDIHKNHKHRHGHHKHHGKGHHVHKHHQGHEHKSHKH